MNLTPEKRNQTAKWLIKIAAVCILLYLGLQNIAAISAALSRFLDLIMPLILGGSHRGHPECADALSGGASLDEERSSALTEAEKADGVPALRAVHHRGIPRRDPARHPGARRRIQRHRPGHR